MKKLIFLSIFLLLAIPSMAQTINFEWDPHPQAAQLEGFKLYQATSPGAYNMAAPAATFTGGSTVTGSIPEPGIGHYYWVLTAYVQDLQSLPSNEVTLAIPPSAPVLQITDGPIAEVQDSRRTVHFTWKTNKASNSVITLTRQDNRNVTYESYNDFLVEDHQVVIEQLQPNKYWEYVASSESEDGQVAAASGSFYNGR